MSRFLEKTDYKQFIDNDELEIITTDEEGSLTSNQIREQVEDTAQSKIIKWIGEIHDTNTIFSTTGDTRDKTMIEYMIYFVLYILYARKAKKNVPEDRYDQYKEAFDMFKAVFKGEKTIKGLPLLDDTQKNESHVIESDEPYSTDY